MQTESFYNRLAIFYPIVDLFLKPQKKILLNEINQLPEGNLLEIGVGNGSHLHLYKNHTIIGIDSSVKMLEIAAKQNGKNIELVEMDGTELLFNNEQFDYVVLSHVIAVVSDQEQLFREILRVLKPQGQVFILNHFTPDNWLKYIDYTFGIFSRAFHFKSIFHIEDIKTIAKFSLLKESRLGITSYFKLLIYQKK